MGFARWLSESIDLASLRVQLGTRLTKGLGAGANPEVGREAAEEDRARLKELLEGVQLEVLLLLLATIRTEDDAGHRAGQRGPEVGRQRRDAQGRLPSSANELRRVLAGVKVVEVPFGQVAQVAGASTGVCPTWLT